ncbi:hypothetical protein CFBP7129_25590 [Agrobacterium tumefaciens]|uniref:Uncharacterized protein n=1 Tax=Agrobacterium tumefaciens TaxID=358 RepID=A0A4D7YUL5_AGRTU|nr:hypothetical protein CFBP7129_25590 [Agrobacterium tumefaciens]
MVASFDQPKILTQYSVKITDVQGSRALISASRYVSTLDAGGLDKTDVAYIALWLTFPVVVVVAACVFERFIERPSTMC